MATEGCRRTTAVDGDDIGVLRRPVPTVDPGAPVCHRQKIHCLHVNLIWHNISIAREWRCCNEKPTGNHPKQYPGTTARNCPDQGRCRGSCSVAIEKPGTSGHARVERSQHQPLRSGRYELVRSKQKEWEFAVELVKLHRALLRLFATPDANLHAWLTSDNSISRANRSKLCKLHGE